MLLIRLSLDNFTGALSISNGGAFILVFSIDNEQSWNDIKDYRQQVSRFLLLSKFHFGFFAPFFILFTLPKQQLWWKIIHVFLANPCVRLYLPVVKMYRLLLLVIELMTQPTNVKWSATKLIRSFGVGDVAMLNAQPKTTLISSKYLKKL